MGVSPRCCAWYKGPMQVCAAWLSLLLAAPGLAAPPAAPASASEATRGHIFMVIKESDPEEMTPPRTPRPLAELVEAAELTAVELARATPAEVYELLSLLHDARGLAYRLSGGDVVHLCAEIDVLAGLLRRTDLDKSSADRVKRLEAAGRGTLAQQHAGHVCEQPGETPVAVASPAPTALVPAETLIAPRPSRSASESKKVSPATIAGGVLLAVAGGLVVGQAPVQASRLRLRGEADQLRDEVMGTTTDADLQRSAEIRRAADRTRAATVGLAVSAAAVGALGLALVVVGVRKQARGLEVLPHAGPQGAGLLLQGRF